MTYISLQTEAPENYHYSLNIVHLYGDLMNTYGDNGNILMMKYIAEKLGAACTFEIVSLGDGFDEHHYDLAFWGGGQDYEQEIISEDLENISSGLKGFIESGKPMLTICGGYQMLGQYYVNSKGKKINCTGILQHYTENLGNDRFIGDIEIHNDKFNETYYGFENHSGVTYLKGKEQALGKVTFGSGNNGKDKTEGLIYKNTFGSYFHGPLLSRNPRIAYRLVTTALGQKYNDKELNFPDYDENFSYLEGGHVTDYKRKVEKA